MKARIRATGDIYNVIDMNDYRNRIQLEDHNWYTMGEIELIEGNEPDWQQVRIQAAIEIIGRATFTFDKLGNVPDDDFAICAKRAVQMADALVAELQKKEGQDD